MTLQTLFTNGPWCSSSKYLDENSIVAYYSSMSNLIGN